MTGRTVLQGGLVADGLGGDPRPLDVLVERGRVAALFVPSAAPRDAELVDCSGLVVAPGFVDIHTHSDLTRIAYPDAPTRALQGVTTEVIGNCGMSPAPMPTGSDGDTGGFRGVLGPIDVVPELELTWTDCASYLDTLAATPGATNLVPLVGHGSLRYTELGLTIRPASEAERRAMAATLDEALTLGYWGLSLGLMYAPGETSDRAELAALVAILRRHGALLTSHLRGYDRADLVPAVREVLDLAAAGGVPVQVSHLRSIGDDGRGRETAGSAAAAAIELIEASRAAGADVQADAYPYLAGHTTLLQLLPTELRALGGAAVAELAHAEPDRVAAALRLGTVVNPDCVVVAKTAAAADAGAVGRTLAELAAGDVVSDRAGGDGADVAARLLARAAGNVDVIVVGSRQEDTDRVLRQPWVSVASDGLALSLDHNANLAHPRSIGTFPRAFRQLADEGVGVGEIVRKMTSQPARRVGLADRGVLQPGAAADVVVFAPDAMQDNADYRGPLRPPSGVEHVLVGGTAVVSGGAATGARPGTLLRRTG